MWSEIPGANVGNWLLQKLSAPLRDRVRDSALLRWLNTQTGRDDWHVIRRADYDDLWRELPDRLLDDLRENLPQRPGMACRAAVFLDTYETLTQGLEGAQQMHNREAAVRALCRQDSPLLVLVFGRDKLRWEEADWKFREAACLEQHLVGGLTRRDAVAFLEKCGVVEPVLREAVLRVSVDADTRPRLEGNGEREPGYHPFTLGLCADTIDEARKRGEAIQAAEFDMAPGDILALAQRFLRSLSSRALEGWVKLLAFPPRWDEAAARAGYGGQPGVGQDAAFEALLDFSFVQEAETAGWWRLHSRMRYALKEIEGERGRAKQAHEFWREHWRERSQSATEG